MLSEKRNNEEWINKYQNKISDWTNDIKNQMSQIQNWDMNEFWKVVFEQNRHIHFMTRRFIENWIDFVKGKGNIDRLQGNDYVRHMITRREAQIKGKRSRLRNPRMLEQWEGESGANPLDFRWRVARRLVNDILLGLKGKKE